MKKELLKDGVLIFIIVSFLIVMNFVCLGFAKNGLSAPFSYSGGDDFGQWVGIKTIIEKGWIRKNNSLGAPYGMGFYGFPANCLTNIENLNTFIISRFSNNPFVVFNIQFLWTICLCAIIAFVVLRYLNINRVFAALGAVLYGMSPCIYLRHFCLAACEFVPLSILLCVLAIEDDKNYLSMKGGIKGFFTYKKNIWMFFSTLLIANNGIGYYPFFTCFFLCVTTVVILFRTKSIACVRKTIVPICCIVFFMLLALVPFFVHKNSNDGSSFAGRAMEEWELYGFKVTQLFMPTNNHHVGIVRKTVSGYNASTYLVNENRAVYLGVFACVGLLVSLLVSFIPMKETKKTNIVKLFSKLSIWSLLFFSIGGFVVLFCIITKFSSLRAFNRVSIFIEFMGMATLCLCLQDFFESKWLKERHIFYWLCLFLVGIFSLFCIWEQHPSVGAYNNRRAIYKSRQQDDAEFVRQIESMLQEKDAVFQLPYHKFPEAGPVRGMMDYHLFTGYINSSKLRWSYGGINGSESDKWNEKVSSLPMEEMVNAIVQSGFRGIYIDSRAYTDEELQKLCAEIESVLQYKKPIVSKNGDLYFYNLYEYVKEHPELVGLPIYDIGF